MVRYLILLIITHAYCECPLNSYKYISTCVCEDGFYKVESESQSINSIEESFECVPEEKPDIINVDERSYSLVNYKKERSRSKSLVTFYNNYLSLQIVATQSNIFFKKQRGSMGSVGFQLGAGASYMSISYGYTKYLGSNITYHTLYLGSPAYFGIGVGGAIVDDVLRLSPALYFSLPSFEIATLDLYPTFRISGFGIENGETEYGYQEYDSAVILDIGIRYIF